MSPKSDNTTIRIAIQGIAGSYHEQAAHELFAARNQTHITTLPCYTFKELFEAMEADNSLLGLIAIENTIAGSLLPNYEMLSNSQSQIVGEYKLRISHCMAALQSETLDSIVEVNSHPIALRQCEDFLSKLPKAKIVEKDDTANAAKWIAETKQTGHAAICSKTAAKQYGLQILAEGIETNQRNFTRFLLLAHHQYAANFNSTNTKNKASLTFTLPHTEGSLSKVLTILSFYNINLTKIQSLPIIGQEWEYRFYIDLSFNDHTRLHQSLDAIRPLTNDLKSLGEYTATQSPAL
ncbi:MAG: prephenate dehydratase [Bacteroidales bacterium]